MERKKKKNNKKNTNNLIQLSFLINEFYVELFILLLLIKFQFNICGYLFILLLMNFIFYVKFFICFHMCLRFSFYLILLSIWVNLSIYIDIVFVDLVFGLKFLLIIFFLLYMADKASLFFQKKMKTATYVFQPREW